MSTSSGGLSYEVEYEYDDDPAREIYIYKKKIDYYLNRLSLIKGTYQYYNWFYIRLKRILKKIDTKIEDFDVIDDEHRFTSELENKDPGSWISTKWANKYNSLMYLFSKFYHIETIFKNSQQNTSVPYFYDSPQFNMMIRLFKHLKGDKPTVLIEQPYDFMIIQQPNGSFSIEESYEIARRQIIRDLLVNSRDINTICVAVKINLLQGIFHENLLIFNKSEQVMYLLEPNIEKNQSVEIFGGIIRFMDQYRQIYFPEFTELKYYKQEPISDDHGGLCAPLSILAFIYPTATLLQVKEILTNFVLFQRNEVIKSIIELRTLRNSVPNAGIYNNAPSLSLNQSVYRNSEMPDHQDNSEYEDSFGSSYDDEAISRYSGFGKKSLITVQQDIDYLVKLKV